MGVSRALAIVLVIAWLACSALGGGLRKALSVYRPLATGRPLTSPQQPDARNPEPGPYVDALEAARQALDATHRSPSARPTVAVVLPSDDRPSFDRAPTRIYEANYRLYPALADFYLPSSSGKTEPYWFQAPPNTLPIPIPLYEHDVVIWAAGLPQGQVTGYEAIFANSAARVYRRRDG